jgi:hypothetical protein
MSPELTLLIVNAVFLAFAYLWAYPRLPDKTMTAILWRDLAITGAALAVAGLLYAGQDLRFDMLLFETRWWLFAFLSMLVMETPLFLWFSARHGIDWSGGGKDGDR